MPLPGKGKAKSIAKDTDKVTADEALNAIDMPEEAKQADREDAEEYEAEAEVEKPAEALPFDADQSYEEPAPRSTTAVVNPPAARQTTEVAAPQSTGATSTEVLNALAEDGFEGVEGGYGTFPQVVLDKGMFKSSEGWEMGTGFDCHVQGARKKLLYKNTLCDRRDEDVIFSYDGVTDTNNKPVVDTITHWENQGWGYEVKEYREVPAVLIGGDWDGEFVLLSIAPTSVRRFNGWLIKSQLKLGRTGQKIADLVCEVRIGPEVTNVDYPFVPWQFSTKA